ncbi:MAG: hypothetical protein U0871_17560 [Gemmataceae bacterium]
MLTLLCLLTLSASDPSPDAVRLKARAALALVFAAPKPPTYAKQYAAAVRDRVPLVVWVGQPAAPCPGCQTVQVVRFAGIDGPAVVIGLPTGPTLRRLDLPGTPTPAAVRAAVAGSGWVQ